MDASASMLWLMAGLGAFHGLNPAMGWLFAVALGLQEKSGRAVARALVPIALGHLLAIAGVVLLTVLAGVAVPGQALRVVVGVALMSLGAVGLVKHLHPRWVRMRVGFRDLIVWSSLVATVHGAGLMVAPALIGSSGVHAAVHGGAHGAAPISSLISPLAGLLATLAHTVGYLAVTGMIAGIVYRWVGVGFLRTAWLNIDLVWAVTLMATGALTLVL